jgi:hypothetical protein
MASTSIPQYDPGSDEVWDAHYSLRTTIRRQAQQIKVQEDAIADLKAKVANLTAATAALIGYLEPKDGEWVCEEGQPPEWEEYTPKAPSYADYTALLYEIPAEVIRHGR